MGYYDNNDGNVPSNGNPYYQDNDVNTANSNPYGNQYSNQYSDPYGNQTNSQYGEPLNEDYYRSSIQPQRGVGVGSFVTADVLNSVLTKSFMYMFMALLITGITSLVVASSPDLVRMFWAGSMIPFWICVISELALVFACRAAIKANNVVLSAALFIAYSIVNGLTLSVIFLVYSLDSIVMVFLLTSVLFAVLAGIGAFTKRDISSWGIYLLVGLFGIIIGSVINMFLHSSTFDYFLTFIGIGVFMGLTIYDVNKIKRISSENTGLSLNVLGFYGAMELYLHFINLFLKLLRLMGKRK